MNDSYDLREVVSNSFGDGSTYGEKKNQQDWIKEINASFKDREKTIERGRKIIRRFEDERDGVNTLERRFNIFTTNVEILQSALYAQIPRVEVKRRFNDLRDKPALLAADTIKRMIDIDLARQDNDFDRTMMDCVFDRLVPGGGYAWLLFNPEIETVMTTMETGEQVEVERVLDYYVDIEHVFWEDFFWSPARSWETVRWVARRVYMTREQLIARFGEEKGKQIPLDSKPERGRDSTSASANEPRDSVVPQAKIYELWDKTSRCVYWISMGMSEIIEHKEDPLGLDSFWPCPRPLFARKTTSRFMPIADFYILQDQYEQLDRIHDRLSLLTDACKVVGAYDRNMSSLPDVLKGGENKLVPVDNWVMFAEKGGMKGVIDWLPIEVIAGVIGQLTQRSEAVKQNIYELSGISDIMRGATNPYEGVGSQQIKAQFASARLQRMQNEIARYAGEILTIKAEIMLRHFPVEFMVEKSNVLSTVRQEDLPVMEQAVMLLHNEEKFGWRVEIQPDSMAMIDYNQEKQTKTEFIQASASFLNNAIPVMAQQPQVAPMMAELLKFGVSGFKNTQNLELVLDRYIDQMVQAAQQPKGPPPEVQKMQMEMQKMQAEIQLKQQEQASDLQMKQQEHQLEMQECIQEYQLKMRMMQEEHAAEMQINRENNTLEAEMKQFSARMDAIVKMFEAQNKAAIAEREAMNKPEPENGA